jgi:hypothetical protein
MRRHLATLLLLATLAPASGTAQSGEGAKRICLAPASVKSTPGSAATAADAVREAFTTFLTGPTLSVAPLSARLESQLREEARLADCRFTLLTTVEHRRKSGSSLLSRAAGSAVQHGAWRAGAEAGSGVARVAADAAVGAVSATASDWASAVRTKDELALTYRLEGADANVLLEKRVKRKAQSDGEDLLTPLVEQAAVAIADAVLTHAR